MSIAERAVSCRVFVHFSDIQMRVNRIVKYILFARLIAGNIQEQNRNLSRRRRVALDSSKALFFMQLFNAGTVVG